MTASVSASGAPLTLAFTPIAGPAEGPLVVLGPSLGSSTALVWERVIPLLTAAGYRVTAWDLPGHAGSAPADGAFTVADIADAVAAGVADQAADGFFSAGVSLGGATGLELVLRHPDVVRAAAIVASGPKIGEAAGWHERAALVRAQGTGVLVEPTAGRWYSEGFRRDHADEVARQVAAVGATDDESYARCCEALASFDVIDRLGEIATPLSALWGRWDVVVGQELNEMLAAAVQNGEAHGIAAAHIPSVEAPEETAELLLATFARG